MVRIENIRKTENVRNYNVLHRVKEEKYKTDNRKKKDNSIGHIFIENSFKNTLLKKDNIKNISDWKMVNET